MVEGLAVRVARLDGNGVEVVLVTSASQTRVAELGVERVVAEEERDLAGEALGLVDGPGVAVLEVVGDVVERERDVSAAVAADPDATSVGAGDTAEVTVEDAEVVAVLKGEDAVADAVALVVDRGDVRPELPCAFERGARAR